MSRRPTVRKNLAGLPSRLAGPAQTPDMVDCKKRIQENHMRNLKHFLDDYDRKEASREAKDDDRYARLAAEARDKFTQEENEQNDPPN